jgi:6-phosphofructokinase 1
MSNGKHFGILASGGNCPGIDVVVRSFIEQAQDDGNEVYPIHNGLNGLLVKQQLTAYPLMTRFQLQELFNGHGSKLGCSRDFIGPQHAERAARTIAEYVEEYGLETLCVIGGDGSAAGTKHAIDAMDTIGKVQKPGIVLAPKTIDNDLLRTERTFGHRTAVANIAWNLRTIRNDAMSHKRVNLVQVPGREAGWLALRGGKSGGADYTLIPEQPVPVEEICQRIVDLYAAQQHVIVCVGEGFVPEGVEEKDVKTTDENGNNGRFTPAAYLAGKLNEQMAGQFPHINSEKLPARAVSIDSEQLRGLPPTPTDIIFCEEVGATAAHLANEGIRDVAIVRKHGEVDVVPLATIVGGARGVPEGAYDRQKLRMRDIPGGFDARLQHYKQSLINDESGTLPS